MRTLALLTLSCCLFGADVQPTAGRPREEIVTSYHSAFNAAWRVAYGIPAGVAKTLTAKQRHAFEVRAKKLVQARDGTCKTDQPPQVMAKLQDDFMREMDEAARDADFQAVMIAMLGEAVSTPYFKGPEHFPNTKEAGRASTPGKAGTVGPGDVIVQPGVPADGP